MSITEYMGQLLGPRPVQEIVITRYEDNKVNFQFEGMRGPIPPQEAYQLLALVANEVAKQMAQEPAPPQEALTPHE